MQGHTGFEKAFYPCILANLYGKVDPFPYIPSANISKDRSFFQIYLSITIFSYNLSTFNFFPCEEYILFIVYPEVYLDRLLGR